MEKLCQEQRTVRNESAKDQKLHGPDDPTQIDSSSFPVRTANASFFLLKLLLVFSTIQFPTI